MKEIWKDVPSYEGRYQVSSKGRVKRFFWNSIQCPKWRMIINPTKDSHGYLKVGLNDGYGNVKTFGIHRLVALAFIPNPENRSEPNHKDHNPANNKVWNLEWITHAENIKHSWTKTKRNKNRSYAYMKSKAA